MVLAVLLLVGSAVARKWGVNIHYTRAPVAGETAMLSSAFKVARMDLSWTSIEMTKGVYTFDAYDALVQDMTSHGVALYLILDYSSPFYDNNLSPFSDEGIAAFTAFSVACVSRYANTGAIFEMYNEPNGGFWTPVANATAYAWLALSVGKAVRALPNGASVTFVGPALSGLDPTELVAGGWLDTVFKSGVLELFDAVSVHPYRATAPELVLPAYADLRAFIRTYTLRTVPLYSGEWGYSTCVWPCDPPSFTGQVDDYTQAKYLARQWLVNDLVNISLSIWYDWIDDCDNTTMRECMFGTVHTDPTGNISQPFAPKMAYTAARVLQQRLGSSAAPHQLPATSSSNASAFALQYSSGASTVFAVWNTNGTSPNGTSCNASGTHEDCGFYGISQQQCEARGCCFQEPYQFGPQCFYRLPLGNTTYATTVHFATPAVTVGSCFQVTSMLGAVVNTTCAQSSPGGAGLAAISVFVADDAPVYLFGV